MAEKASVNASRGATVERELAREARQKGEFAREKEVDVGAKKGGRLPALPEAPGFQDPEFKAAQESWKSSKSTKQNTNTNPKSTTSTSMTKSAEQLDLPFEKPNKAEKVASKLTKAGKLFGAAIPFVGTALGHASAAHAASQGNYKEAALDEAGNVPVAGDVLDAARAGMALGEALDEGLEVSDKASSVGIAVQETLTDIGINEDVSYVVGGVATVASIGTITVASTAKAAAETATSAATSAAKAVADTTTSVAKSTWNWLVN